MSSSGQNLSSTQDGRTNFDPASGWTVNDGTSNRVLIGKRKDGSYGIDVSKTGQEVIGATGSQLVMSSQFNSFKIVGTGTTSFTVPSPNTVATTYSAYFPHNLGFSPGVIAFINSAGTRLPAGANFPLPKIFYGYPSAGNLPINAILEAATDSTNVQFALYVGDINTQYSGTWTIRYYLTQETAS